MPDVLVMTATPIPRTAAMTVYGDLDVSRARRAAARAHADRHACGPTGRRSTRPTAWDDGAREVAAGRQAYVVCPLIEESEKLEVASAEETYERLRDGELAGLRLGLLHGRMPAGREGGGDGARSGAGELDVLVATTVIEVGVDVPNATVMVILDADRFGIAQLHQLRGRVGRGAARVAVLAASAQAPRRTARPGSRRWCATDRRVRAGRGRPRPARRGHADGRSGRRAATTSSWRRCGATASWSCRPVRWPSSIVDADPDARRHPDLLDELRCCSPTTTTEFLTRS